MVDWCCRCTHDLQVMGGGLVLRPGGLCVQTLAVAVQLVAESRQLSSCFLRAPCALSNSQVQTYHRLSPLVVMNKALGSVAELQEGDCMVAFSRRAVHGLKREVLRRTSHQCAVVYGKSCKHSGL